ncbi:hypothetical protein [Methylocystis iwaonis]|uniref:Addiction module protein n=1 Tax=Methylocystis iwaonis TaxID=2885079 RepID=A0ABM8ED29_9HYPH|nr:hypothetical protein [Methylocystis iwaonis]BDV35855.1 hypothetical protein SS37A_33840 [Methylocystis iwaonis]
MTKLLDEAVGVLRSLPPQDQDEIARMIIELTGEGGAPVSLSPDEKAAIARSKAAAARGEFATEAQIRSVWEKHGL